MYHESINQSGALLFNVGDHDLPRFATLVAFRAAITLLTLSLFVRSSNIYSHCFPLLRFLSIIYNFMSDLVMSAFRNTVSSDVFAVQEILSILRRNHISVASTFYCTCFEIVQASHPYIRMGSIALHGSSCENRDVFVC